MTDYYFWPKQDWAVACGCAIWPNMPQGILGVFISQYETVLFVRTYNSRKMTNTHFSRARAVSFGQKDRLYISAIRGEPYFLWPSRTLTQNILKSFSRWELRVETTEIINMMMTTMAFAFLYGKWTTESRGWCDAKVTATRIAAALLPLPINYRLTAEMVPVVIMEQKLCCPCQTIGHPQ